VKPRRPQCRATFQHFQLSTGSRLINSTFIRALHEVSRGSRLGWKLRCHHTIFKEDGRWCQQLVVGTYSRHADMDNIFSCFSHGGPFATRNWYCPARRFLFWLRSLPLTPDRILGNRSLTLHKDSLRRCMPQHVVCPKPYTSRSLGRQQIRFFFSAV
jgi:hypothetical protein